MPLSNSDAAPCRLPRSCTDKSASHPPGSGRHPLSADRRNPACRTGRQPSRPMSSASACHLDVGLLPGENLRTVKVAAISDDIEMISTKNVLGLRCFVVKWGATGAGIRHLVCDDQMMLRVHSDLHVVADDARAAATRRHRT